MQNEYHLKLLCDMIHFSREAGKLILSYYEKSDDQLQVSLKPDNTLLTEADIAANQFIVDKLQSITPDFHVLAEESDIPDFNERVHWEHYWLVDPLDGTRGFVERRAEFTVNIALIEHDRPIIGVVYVPCEKICYYAVRGDGAFKQVDDEVATPIHTLPLDSDAVNVLVGHYLHQAKLPEKLKNRSDNWSISNVNSSWKFGLLAEGQADIYPRLGPTSEWDTAAGQIILEEAGGCVVDLKGEPLRYNTKESLINPSFLALGDPTCLDSILKIMREK